MEALRSLGGITGAHTVQERAAGGGGKRQADAFRKAMSQEGAETPAAETPVRAALQPRARGVRRDLGTVARHVDVLA